MGIRPERSGPLCEAEKKNQVLFRTMDQLLGDVRHGPLFNPQSEGKITACLAALKAGLQRQADDTVSSEPISVELPADLEELLRVTDGISGAGVPSETADTWLVGGIRGLEPERGKPGERHYLYNWWRKHWVPFAAFELGGCTQHRQIYYVLCRDAHDDAAPIAWRVMDRDDVELDVYNSLAEFLEHETLHIEERAGGHKQELILYDDRYPSYRWWDMQGGAWVEDDGSD